MVNIKLIEAAIVLSKKWLMSGKDMFFAINAYLLVARETKSEFLELNYEKIQKALRVRIRSSIVLAYEQSDSYEDVLVLVFEDEALPCVSIERQNRLWEDYEKVRKVVWNPYQAVTAT